MTHWIIEDKGFGGVQYTCSKCKNTWNDLYQTTVGEWNICPWCHRRIDRDKDEYIEEKPGLEKVKEAIEKLDSIPPIHINWSSEYKRDATNIRKLEQVSGKSIEELVELFAAGWTLRPPTKFSDLLSMLDMED